MKLMTFNIRHGRIMAENKIDLPSIAAVIREEKGEIVCLNEVYGEGPHKAFTEQAKELGELLGYEYYFAPAIHIDQCGPYGNAFLSKYPILSVRTVPVPTVPRNHPGYFEDRAAFHAVIQVENRKLTVIGCHFGLQIEEQQECAGTVCKLVDESPYPVVLMGDFNVTPESEILNPIRERLVDTADFLSGCNFTFSSEKPEMKIDYIFVSKNLRIEKTEIPQAVVSDHFPMTSVVSFT